MAIALTLCFFVLILGSSVLARQASEKEVPYQASVRHIDQHKCSGAILDKRWVLTTDFCVYQLTPRNAHVTVGSIDLLTPGQILSISDIIIKTKVSTSSKVLGTIVALIKLAEDIKFDESAQPIALPDRDVEHGDTFKVSGWSIDSESSTDDDDVLKVNTVQDLDMFTENCLFYHRHAIVTTFCVTRDKKYSDDVAIDDVGGPVVSRTKIRKLSGLIIKMYRAPKQVVDGLAIRVFKSKEWIENTIAGVREARKNEVPYQVSIRKNGKHKCSGAIVDKRWILTSDYCVHNLRPIHNDIMIGSNDLTEATQFLDIIDVKVSRKGINDIGVLGVYVALIKVRKDIEFNDSIQPIPLTDREIESDESLQVSGWAKRKDSSVKPHLLVNDLKELSRSYCTLIRYYQEETFCMKSDTNSSNGVIDDAGGPVKGDNGKLVGLVVKMTTDADEDIVGVGIRVYQYLKFINKTISKF